MKRVSMFGDAADTVGNALLMGIGFAVLAAFLCSCSYTRPVAATGEPIGERVGVSSSVRILGAWVSGDASIATAAKNGGVHRIATVDLKVVDVLGVYHRETCIVR